MQTFQHALTSFLFRLPQVVPSLRWAPDALLPAAPRPSEAMYRRRSEFIHHVLQLCFAFPVTQCKDCIVSLGPLLCSRKMFRKPKINVAASSLKMAVEPGVASAPFFCVSYLSPSSQPFPFSPAPPFLSINSAVISGADASCLQSSKPSTAWRN